MDSELQPEPQEELYKAQGKPFPLPPSHGALEEDPSLGIYRDVCYVNLKGKERASHPPRMQRRFCLGGVFSAVL